MSPMHIQKVERFKARVDFDAALRSENAAQAVHTVWPDMLGAPGLDAGWTIAADTTWPADGGVAREWVLRHGEAQIAIVLFVSSAGPEPAGRFLLARATENMMRDAPFVKSPDRLGTLAVTMPATALPNLIWVFRTLCSDVRAIDARVDIAPIARWLQSAAEAGLVAAQAARLRSPGALQVSARRVAVGASVEIRVQAATADEIRYMIAPGFDSRLLTVESQERLAIRLRALAAGHTTVDLRLIDTATLLSEQSAVALELIPR